MYTKLSKKPVETVNAVSIETVTNLSGIDLLECIHSRNPALANELIKQVENTRYYGLHSFVLGLSPVAAIANILEDASLLKGDDKTVLGALVNRRGSSYVLTGLLADAYNVIEEVIKEHMPESDFTASDIAKEYAWKAKVGRNKAAQHKRRSDAAKYRAMLRTIQFINSSNN